MFVNNRSKFCSKTEISYKQQKHYKSALDVISLFLNFTPENDACRLCEKRILFRYT